MHHYDTPILKILAEVGNRGLNVRKITLHVYNAVNTLFEPADKQEVHDYVLKFLSSHVKRKNPLLERVSHGVYRLNPKSAEARRLKLMFREKSMEEEEKKTVDPNQSQLLFDFGDD